MSWSRPLGAAGAGSVAVVQVYSSPAFLPPTGDVHVAYRVLDDGTGALADYAWDPGLAAYVKLSGGGGGAYAIVPKAVTSTDSPYTLVPTYNLYLASAPTADLQLLLPSAATWTGASVFVKREGQSAYAVTLRATGGQTLDGSTSAVTLALANQALEVAPDGANWKIVG